MVTNDHFLNPDDSSVLFNQQSLEPYSHDSRSFKNAIRQNHIRFSDSHVQCRFSHTRCDIGWVYLSRNNKDHT